MAILVKCVFVFFALLLHTELELLWLVHPVAWLAFYVVLCVVLAPHILVHVHLQFFFDSPILGQFQHISCLPNQQLFCSIVLAPFSNALRVLFQHFLHQSHPLPM